MDSNCRKLGETPYRECRKQAAIYNDALGSMERTTIKIFWRSSAWIR